MKFELQSAWFKREQDDLQRQMILVIMCGTGRDLVDIIDRGADVNAPDPQGTGKVYPLTIAIRQNKPDMVKTLLEAGANPLRRHQAGKQNMPLSALARIYKNPQIIEMVRAAEEKALARQNRPSPPHNGL